jgi:hypothetical protein
MRIVGNICLCFLGIFNIGIARFTLTDEIFGPGCEYGLPMGSHIYRTWQGTIPAYPVDVAPTTGTNRAGTRRYHHLDGGREGAEGAVAAAVAGTAVLAEGEAAGAAGRGGGTNNHINSCECLLKAHCR